MKRIVLSMLLFCLAQKVFCQLSGKLVSASGEPVPFASVVLLNSHDTSFVKGTVTNVHGAYALDNITAGHYFLRYSAIGFRTYTSGVFEWTIRKRQDLGTRILEEDTRLLEEVVVQGERPLYQQEIDRLVINVESSIMAKGSSALEVLERSPGITIDRQNNSLALNGKSDVLVMLNGKLMRLTAAQVITMLNGMSANTIEKIELLTTPPARYDAEGSGGIINIVLKKNEATGTTGSFSLTGGYGEGEKGTGSVSLAHGAGKINVYGSYAFSRDRTHSGWRAESTQNMPAMGGALAVSFVNDVKALSANHNATLGLDLNLEKTTLGGSINYYNSVVNSSVQNNARYDLVEQDSLFRMKADTQSRNRWMNTITSIYVAQELREGEKISFDADYLHYRIENPTDTYTAFTGRDGNSISLPGSIFSTRQRGSTTTPIQVGVLKADYTRQVTKLLKAEAGVKGTYTRSASRSAIESLENDEWVTSPRTSNDIDVQEGIGAAYASFHWQIDPSVSLMTGVRYEYSRTYMRSPKEENNIDRKLGKLFPSVFFSRKLNDKSEVQLSYTKRISRPSYNDLASSILYNDPMSVSTGNPSLRPTVTHNLKAGYTYDGYSFSILLSRDDYPISRYQLTENPAHDLMYVSPQNLYYQKTLTFQANLPLRITRWWSFTTGMTGNWRQFRLAHTNDHLVKTYFVFTANGSQVITLPKNFSLEISGWYTSMFFNGSNKVDGFGVLNAGIKKELRNNGGSFQLSVGDLFKSLVISNYFGHLTEEAFSIKSHVVFTAESARSRIVKITYSRSFGNTKVKQQQRSTGSQDEIDRIRKD